MPGDTTAAPTLRSPRRISWSGLIGSLARMRRRATAPMTAMSAGSSDEAETFVLSPSSPSAAGLAASADSGRTTRPTCVGGTVADGTTNSLSSIMRSLISAFGHSAQVTSFDSRISPGLMVRPATSTFVTPVGFSSCTTTGCACRSRNTLTRNAAAPARTKAMTASMMTDGLMEKPAPLPTKNLQRGLVRVSAIDPMLGVHGEGLVNYRGAICALLRRARTWANFSRGARHRAVFAGAAAKFRKTRGNSTPRIRS